MASLNDDSGYGGSIAGESQIGPADLNEWHAGLMEDRPTPSNTPVLPGDLNDGLFSLMLALRDKKHADYAIAEQGKQIVASHVHQLL
jgi:mitofusin